MAFRSISPTTVEKVAAADLERSLLHCNALLAALMRIDPKLKLAEGAAANHKLSFLDA